MWEMTSLPQKALITSSNEADSPSISLDKDICVLSATKPQALGQKHDEFFIVSLFMVTSLI